MAGAFDNLLLLERLAESNRQLGVLAESSLEFGASLDLTEVLDSVASRMCLAAAAACCDIYAIEGDELRGLVSTDGSVIDDGVPRDDLPAGRLRRGASRDRARPAGGRRRHP